MSVHFVTGATGAVGGAVVARLLEDPHAEVFALVRAPDADAARARLSAELDVPAADRPRVVALPGDAERPRFGLADADHARLVAGCTRIIHCAGAVRMNLPLEAARRAAVESARHVIALARELAAAGHLDKVDMVSTVGVAGRAHRLLPETWVGAAHPFHNTYEQAKAEAEQLAHEAIIDGLPLTVHRPSMVVGDSRTGRTRHFQIFYYLVEFLSGRRTRGVFPNLGDARLDTVPMDVVAEAIVRSSGSAGTVGRILHLCAGPREAIPLRRLQALIAERLRARGERVPAARYVPAAAFRALARTIGLVSSRRMRAALATLPVFLAYLETGQAFDDTQSSRWLREAGIALPPPGDYLPRVLDYYWDTRALRASDTPPERRHA